MKLTKRDEFNILTVVMSTFWRLVSSRSEIAAMNRDKAVEQVNISKMCYKKVKDVIERL